MIWTGLTRCFPWLNVPCSDEAVKTQGALTLTSSVCAWLLWLLWLLVPVQVCTRRRKLIYWPRFFLAPQHDRQDRSFPSDGTSFSHTHHFLLTMCETVQAVSHVQACLIRSMKAGGSSQTGQRRDLGAVVPPSGAQFSLSSDKIQLRGHNTRRRCRGEQPCDSAPSLFGCLSFFFFFSPF